MSKGYLRSIPSQNSMKYLMFIIFLKVLYFAIGSTFLDYLFLKIREGNGSPLQYSWMENPMNRGAWGATVHGVANSRTRLSDSHTHTHFHYYYIWWSVILEVTTVIVLEPQNHAHIMMVNLINVCVLTAPLTSRSPISLPLRRPPYSLRHNNIETRSINNLQCL